MHIFQCSHFPKYMSKSCAAHQKLLMFLRQNIIMMDYFHALIPKTFLSFHNTLNFQRHLLATIRDSMGGLDCMAALFLNGGRDLVMVRRMGLNEIKGTLGITSGCAAHILIRGGTLEVDILHIVKVGLE